MFFTFLIFSIFHFLYTLQRKNLKEGGSIIHIWTMQALLGSIIGPRKERHDLSGRVAVVTGGAFGIG
jgi:hypothetical protein